MLNANAIRFCEAMANVNQHFYNWTMEKGYARIHPIYGCYALTVSKNARKIINEYRKQYKFTKENYMYWDKYYAFRWGEVWEGTRI